MRFREFLKLQEAGAYLPSVWTGTETPDPVLPHLSSTDLELPTVTKSGKILVIDDKKKKNQVLVFLDDNTQLFIPYDAYRRIHGEPAVGKTMTVIFQRRDDDSSPVPSQIQSIQCY